MTQMTRMTRPSQCVFLPYGGRGTVEGGEEQKVTTVPKKQSDIMAPGEKDHPCRGESEATKGDSGQKVTTVWKKEAI